MTARALQKLFDAASRQKVVLQSSSKVTKLKKCLGTFDLMAIGIGCTFGSGIYVLTGQVAKGTAGPAVVLSFFIAAVASLMSGICYTEFATRVPMAGSAYLYTYVTVGEFIAFSIGWNLILEYVIGGAVIARAFSVYVDTFTGGLIANATREATGVVRIHGLNSDLDFLSFGLVVVLSILLATGIRNSTIFNNILTIFNILVSACIIIVGLFYVKLENWSNFAPFGINGVMSGASTCFFAFIGFDVIATTAEEAKNPAKSIPWSILGTISVCFVIYFAVSVVITLMVPYQNLNSESAVSDAFGQVGADWAKYLVSAGAGISMLGCTLVSLFPLPRIIYSMAQDGLIPTCFATVNAKTESPIIATLVSGLFTALLAMLINVHDLVEMLSIGTLLAYTMVNLCVIKLRYQLKIGLSTSPVSSPINPRSCYVENADHNQETLKNGKSKDQLQMEKSQKKHNRVISLVLALIVIDSVLLSVLLVFGRTFNTIAYYSFLVVFFIVICLCTLFLWKQPQNQQELFFKAPMVPFLPISAMFINIYLMMQLGRLTWIRMVIWTFIGMIIYLVYGIRHSVVGHRQRNDCDEYSTLINVRQDTEEKSAKSE